MVSYNLFKRYYSIEIKDNKKMNTLQMLSVLLVVTLFAGLAVVTPIMSQNPVYAESPHKDSPSDDDSGGGNDPPKKRGNHPSRNG
jgi:hypothetical protein